MCFNIIFFPFYLARIDQTLPSPPTTTPTISSFLEYLDLMKYVKKCMYISIFFYSRSTISLSSLASNTHIIGEAIARYVFDLTKNETSAGADPEVLVNELVSYVIWLDMERTLSFLAPGF